MIDGGLPTDITLRCRFVGAESGFRKRSVATPALLAPLQALVRQDQI